MYKNLTSVAITEINGQKILAFSYDEIDDAGRVVKDNIRESRVIIKSGNNEEILKVINKLEEYAENLINSI